MKHLKKVILWILVLAALPFACAENFAPMALSKEHRMNLNDFLRQFTTVGDLTYITNLSEDQLLLDFAYDLLRLTQDVEFGEYPGENDVRIADDRVLEVIDRVFYEQLEPIDPTQSSYDYDGEYYYHRETIDPFDENYVRVGGYANVFSIIPVGLNEYLVSFAVFDNWYAGTMDFPTAEAIEQYGVTPNSLGSARIYASDLSDLHTYKLFSYAILG